MKPLRIAISGTYSTGKTTTSYALSYLTGIPRTHAQTMREILPQILPGKRLEECTPVDLYELGIRRLTERVSCESRLETSFISDGSALHEWVYGRARLKYKGHFKWCKFGGEKVKGLKRRCGAGFGSFCVW